MESEVWRLEQELTTLCHDLAILAGHRLDRPRDMCQHTLTALLSARCHSGMRRHLRLLAVLTSPHLRPPHWSALYACLGLPGPSPALLTLQHVMHRLALQRQQQQQPAEAEEGEGGGGPWYESVVAEVEALGQGAQSDAGLQAELQSMTDRLDHMAVQVGQ